jgi:hypothetical protein
LGLNASILPALKHGHPVEMFFWAGCPCEVEVLMHYEWPVSGLASRAGSQARGALKLTITGSTGEAPTTPVSGHIPMSS